MNTKLIAQLRDAAWAGPAPCPVCNEAADALEAARADIEEWKETLHRVMSERDAALARLAELEKQEPIDAVKLEDMVDGLHPDYGRGLYATSNCVTKLYAAAGASPPPSQARELSDAKLYQWCMDHNMILAGGAEFGWPIAPIGRQWDKYIIAAINAKGAAS